MEQNHKLVFFADTSAPLVPAVTCAGVRAAQFRRDVGPDEGTAGSPGLRHRVLDRELRGQQRRQPAGVAGRRQQLPETRLGHSRGPVHWSCQHTGED